MRLRRFLNEGASEINEITLLAQKILNQYVKVNISSIKRVYEYRIQNQDMPLDEFKNFIKNKFEFDNFIYVKDAARGHKWNVLGDFLKKYDIAVIFTNNIKYYGLWSREVLNERGVIYIKRDIDEFASVFSYNIDMNKSKKPSLTDMARASLTSLGIAFRKILIHELQHAYDDWRSSGKYSSDKLSSYYYKNIWKPSSTWVDARMPDEQYKIYLTLPHEYWARFSEAVSTIFHTPSKFNKPFSVIVSEFKKAIGGYERLTENDKKRLLKALYKYYTAGKHASIVITKNKK